MFSLLEILFVAGCLLVLGVNTWVLVKVSLTIDVPPAITHPVKLWILYYIFQLAVTWGNLLERMKICSMPHFCCFLQDLLVLKNADVLVKNLRFGTIPVRVYQPKAASASSRRGIIFFHGGGALFGSLDFYHNVCNFLTLNADAVVLSVGYRRLPEYHHPTISKDCMAASIHFLKALKTYGVDPSKVVMCGDSIGGGAVAGVVQALVGVPDLPPIRAQVLIYPVLQVIHLQLPSHLQNQNVPFLTRDLLMTCICKYLTIDFSWWDALQSGACILPDTWKKYSKLFSPHNIPQRFRGHYQQLEFPAPFNEAAYLETRQLLDADVSPLLADEKIIAQLPETFLVSLNLDVFRDDTLLYKKRLEDQGVPVSWYHVEDGFHGCINLFDKKFFSFPCSLNILNAIASFIKGL